MKPTRPTSEAETLAVGALALAGAGLALVWLWGGIAGTLFGHGWPHLSVDGLLGVLVRLPAHLDQPQLAWPPSARGGLPGRLALLVCLVASVGLIAVVAAIAVHVTGRGWRPRDRGARWASVGDLRLLRRRPGWVDGERRLPLAAAGTRRHQPTTQGGRLVLGRHRGRLLYAERRHALVAFGPPQSGKSAGLAIPALLEWDGPAIASSIKTDLSARRWADVGNLGRRSCSTRSV